MTELTEHEKTLIAKREKIACLRSIRARTGCGLKEAYDILDAYLAAPKEEIVYQRETVVNPQGNDYGCLFCTLEYLTGVPRVRIAQEIGHDGSEVILPLEPKPYCHATLTDAEAVHWLLKRGNAPTSVHTYEFLKELHRQKDLPFYDKRFYIRTNALLDMLTNKAAELMVRSQRFAHGLHSVAYRAGLILDPRDGCVHQISEYQIVGATFTNIDPYARLSEIHAAQPLEKVVTV